MSQPTSPDPRPATPEQPPALEPAGLRLCPDCRAEVPSDAQTCWMCGRVMQANETTSESSVKPGSAVSFSLASLMILVTLVAVGLGLFATAPGLGIMYCIAMVPALVRTAVGVRRRERAGQATALDRKFQLFVTSLAVSIAAGVAAVVAFFATCLSTCAVFVAMEGNLRSTTSEYFVFSAFVLAGILSAAAFGGVFYLFRTSRRKK